jgi:hypothetical protein
MLSIKLSALGILLLPSTLSPTLGDKADYYEDNRYYPLHKYSVGPHSEKLYTLPVVIFKGKMMVRDKGEQLNRVSPGVYYKEIVKGTSRYSSKLHKKQTALSISNKE